MHLMLNQTELHKISSLQSQTTCYIHLQNGYIANMKLNISN